MKNRRGTICAVFICGFFSLLFAFPKFSAAESRFCLQNLAAKSASMEKRSIDENIATAEEYLCALREGTNPEVVIPLLAEEMGKVNISLAHLGTSVEEVVTLVALYYDRQNAWLSHEGFRARRAGVPEPERFYERLGENLIKKLEVISKAKYLFDSGAATSSPKAVK